MSLPDFNSAGDLPPGVHKASMAEVLERFNAGSVQRSLPTQRLLHIHDLAKRTGHLQRFIVFGSYVTTKPQPNDVDIILLMDDDFRLDECPAELRGLFDHSVAQVRYGASIFWARPALLMGESADDFVAYWQIKRDKSLRGIIEVIE